MENMTIEELKEYLENLPLITSKQSDAWLNRMKNQHALYQLYKWAESLPRNINGRLCTCLEG